MPKTHFDTIVFAKELLEDCHDGELKLFYNKIVDDKYYTNVNLKWVTCLSISGNTRNEFLILELVKSPLQDGASCFLVASVRNVKSFLEFGLASVKNPWGQWV